MFAFAKNQVSDSAVADIYWKTYSFHIFSIRSTIQTGLNPPPTLFFYSMAKRQITGSAKANKYLAKTTCDGAILTLYPVAANISSVLFPSENWVWTFFKKVLYNL